MIIEVYSREAQCLPESAHFPESVTKAPPVMSNPDRATNKLKRKRLPQITSGRKAPPLDPDAEIKYILSAVSESGSFRPDWHAVAERNGIKFGKNAKPKFNTIARKYGYRFEGDELVALEAVAERDGWEDRWKRMIGKDYVDVAQAARAVKWAAKGAGKTKEEKKTRFVALMEDRGFVDVLATMSTVEGLDRGLDVDAVSFDELVRIYQTHEEAVKVKSFIDAGPSVATWAWPGFDNDC